jgi:hypothetical protein
MTFIEESRHHRHYIFTALLKLFVYSVQRYMDTEIRAIMAQYMPLDNQPLIVPNPNQVHHDI